MSEGEKLFLETKKEIRSILLSTKTGVEFARLNREYEMFTGSKINFRGMGYGSLREFVDDIPDVARQFDDGYGTITLSGVADESTRHIASLVSRQKGKKKSSFRGRYFPGPRLGLLSNLSMPKSSYSSRSYGESHSNSYGSRFPRTISSRNPAASQMAGKLRSSAVYDQKSAVTARHDQKSVVTARPEQKSAVTALPAKETSKDPGRETMVPTLKTTYQDTKTVVDRKTVVPELHTGVYHSKTFVPTLKQMLSVIAERISVNIMYSTFKKAFEKEFGVKLDLAELGYSSVPEMFLCLEIPVMVKQWCSDDYTIMLDPNPARGNMDKGGNQQRNQVVPSILSLIVSRPPAVAAQSLPPRASESTSFPSPRRAPQYSSSGLAPAPPVQCHAVAAQGLPPRASESTSFPSPRRAPQYSSSGLAPAPPVQCLSVTSRPTSRRMSFTSSRTAPISDNTKMPSTPYISQELKDAISVVLKNSPDGILIGDLEAKLKEMTGVEIDIEATGARSLELLLVHLPGLVEMTYRGHGQLLLFDPGQTNAIKDNTDHGQNFEHKDPPAPDVYCSGRGQGHQSLDSINESRSKYQPRDIPEDSVGPEQVIPTQHLPAGVYQYLPVYVSNVISPGHFWFQIDGQLYDHLVDLMETLQSTYNHPKGSQYEMPPSLMKIGQLCAAKFLEDNNWHRGTIMGFKDSLVQIYYLDYGTTSFVTKDQLRILRSRYLRLPAQAIRARLANVHPAKGEWSEEAYLFFMERITNKRLMALITHSTQDGLVSVCLTDTNGDEDLHLNDCLIVNGFAVLQLDNHEPVASVAKKEDESTSISESNSAAVKPSRNADEAILIAEQDIKFVQLPPNYSCHLVRISDKLYIISNEISAFLWDENILRTMVRQKGYAYLPKLVLRIDDHLAIMEELAKFKIPGVYVDGEFAKILVLYDVSIVIQILEIFEHQSKELKSELKKHLELFNANPSKWTASVVPYVGDEDYVTDLSDDLALRSGLSRCHGEASDSKDAKESKELRKNWKAVAEQRKKLLNQMRSSASPKTSTFAVEELSRMESQMKLLEDRYDVIQKRSHGTMKRENGGSTDVNFNAKINTSLIAASVADAKAEKIRGLVASESSALQKKHRTNAVAPMTQAEPTPVTTDISRGSIPPISQPSAAQPSSASLPQPIVGFTPTVRPGMVYGQQMDSLAQMLSQMTLRNQPPLPSAAGLLGLASLGYQLPNPQLHSPFGYSAAQIVMQQQQSYLAALQGLSNLVSNGSSFAQTPYDASLLGITNLSYLAHAAPAGSALPRADQQGPQQN